MLLRLPAGGAAVISGQLILLRPPGGAFHLVPAIKRSNKTASGAALLGAAGNERAAINLNPTAAEGQTGPDRTEPARLDQGGSDRTGLDWTATSSLSGLNSSSSSQSKPSF